MPWRKGWRAQRGEDQAGFTLIELLVVVGILAVLAAIAAPRITEVINKSREARSKADLKVISGAIERYYSDNNKYPAKLDDLKTGGYIKFDVSFKNAHGNYYFYAIDDTAAPSAYLLMDPGSTPATTAVIWLNVGATGASPAVPNGLGGANAYQWKPGGSNTVTFKDVNGADLAYSTTPPNIGFDLGNGKYSKSVGAYCMTKTAADPTKPCRSDISTD